MSSQPSRFFSDELHRALREQVFGIAAFQVSTPTTPLETTASVTLLEGRIVKISLSARGYCLLNSSAKRAGQIFETVEALLQSISPVYEARRQEVLVRKLEGLS